MIEGSLAGVTQAIRRIEGRFPGMTRPLRNYCEDCEWAASTETYSRQELSRLAIEHAVEYGHDIESEVPENCLP
jgi:hypothetical protein